LLARVTGAVHGLPRRAFVHQRLWLTSMDSRLACWRCRAVVIARALAGPERRGAIRRMLGSIRV